MRNDDQNGIVILDRMFVIAQITRVDQDMSNKWRKPVQSYFFHVSWRYPSEEKYFDFLGYENTGWFKTVKEIKEFFKSASLKDLMTDKYKETERIFYGR